uniref:Uncharacterized protein n=1 Tax=Anguilla anguilla TaxID=7936 RepID=A0A0E9XT47_ANGAN
MHNLSNSPVLDNFTSALKHCPEQVNSAKNEFYVVMSISYPTRVPSRKVHPTQACFVFCLLTFR